MKSWIVRTISQLKEAYVYLVLCQTSKMEESR